MKKRDNGIVRNAVFASNNLGKPDVPGDANAEASVLDIPSPSVCIDSRFRGAYRALLLFSVLYFYRPEDLFSKFSSVPVGKLSGAIAILALILGIGKTPGRIRLPIEVKLILALFFDLCVTVVFASWHGGAFDAVINRFSKGVIVAVLISIVVTSQNRSGSHAFHCAPTTSTR